MENLVYEYNMSEPKVKTHKTSTAPARRGLELWLPLAASELTARGLRAASVRCDDVSLAPGGRLVVGEQ